jgi:predicted alpha/beta superfamily hydrolase
MLPAPLVVAFEVLPVKLFSRSVLAPLSSLFLLLASACGSGAGEPGGTTTSTSSVGGAMGTGGAGDAQSSASAGGSGGSGGANVEDLDTILNELRADTTGALTKHAGTSGWPVPVQGGHLFVSTDTTLSFCAGDHDAWAGTAMKADMGFDWVVLTVPVGEHYKFTDKTTFLADPWARSYNYDANGEISLVTPNVAHLDRWPAIGDAVLEPRTLRVWVPNEAIKHELYVHDGQNLFNPDAFNGGWHLQDTVPAGMLLVGIDNTAARMDEYTHVPDVISGQTLGGKGDAYADFLKNTVRPLIKKQYGEPGPVGVLGSSLGGLIAFHIADHEPGEYAFAGSLSGTMGWGSIGAGTHNETMIERYQKHGHQKTVLYLDSGGQGPCSDTDGDGIQDDSQTAGDNYCENAQLRDVLYGVGYTKDKDFFYGFAAGATHDEAAWAARVHTPFQIFNAL